MTDKVLETRPLTWHDMMVLHLLVLHKHKQPLAPLGPVLLFTTHLSCAALPKALAHTVLDWASLESLNITNASSLTCLTILTASCFCFLFSPQKSSLTRFVSPMEIPNFSVQQHQFIKSSAGKGAKQKATLKKELFSTDMEKLFSLSSMQCTISKG